jgi:hypothetical protein
MLLCGGKARSGSFNYIGSRVGIMKIFNLKRKREIDCSWSQFENSQGVGVLNSEITGIPTRSA